MGAVAGFLVQQDPNALWVDDSKKTNPLLRGYARSIFRKLEWQTFKIFCNTYAISHADTCVVFKRFLQYEEVYLIHFKVRLKDVTNHFSLHSKLEKEIVDAMVPPMFMKDFPGLEPAPPEGDLVSFARFTIMSYLFCTEQIPDLIHDFIVMLRRRRTMSVNAKIHTYSLDQLMRVMVEDLQPSAASWILIQSLGRMDKEDELTLLGVVKLGIKYPLLFYLVERFRKHIKRLVFGDKFWTARTYLKSRISELDGNASYYGDRFKDERTALIETSRSIIADVVTPHKQPRQYRLTEREVSNVMYLDEEGLQRLKNIFGYERSRQLIVDSEVGLDGESVFVEGAFGVGGPVRRPELGVKVFPGGRPVEVLEVESESESERDGGDREDEEKQMDEDDEEPEIRPESDGVSNTNPPRTTSSQNTNYRAQGGEGGDGAEGLLSPSMMVRMGSWFALSTARKSEKGESVAADKDLSKDGPSHINYMNGTYAGDAGDAGAGPGSPNRRALVSTSPCRVETILDPVLGREFRYDPETGKSAWVRCAVDSDGDVLLETCS